MNRLMNFDSLSKISGSVSFSDLNILMSMMLLLLMITVALACPIVRGEGSHVPHPELVTLVPGAK